MAGGSEKKRLQHNARHLRTVVVGNLVAAALYVLLRSASVLLFGAAQWVPHPIALGWNAAVMWLMYFLVG